jgi:hypothetical protein
MKMIAISAMMVGMVGAVAGLTFGQLVVVIFFQVLFLSGAIAFNHWQERR